MMTRFLCLLALLITPSVAGAATYYADPAGGAAESCVNAGANACTLQRAITVASAGDTINAACGTYDLGSATLAVNKNVAIVLPTAGCGIITTSHATSTVDITASNDANTLSFGAFDLRNTGGAGQILRFLTAAYDATVELSGTIIATGAVNRHIQDTWVRGTIKLTNVTLGGTIGTQAGFYSLLTPTSAKKIQITGGSYLLTASASNTPAILIERAAGVSVSEWVYINGPTVHVTVPTSLGTSALGIGIRLHRITSGTGISGNTEPPIVEHANVTVTALGATGVDALGIVASSTDATAVADNAIFRDNTVTCNGPASRCISIGTDGSTAFNAANAQIYRNTVHSTYYDGSATPHGISVGRVTGGYVWGNTVNGFAVGIITAINQGAVVTGNLIKGAYYAPLFSKGSGATTAPIWANNTVIMDDALYGAKFGNYGCLGVAAQGATNNAGATFINNSCYVKSGTGWKYAVVDASQVASFDSDNYYSLVSLTTPWSYQGTTYATVGLWNAAGTVGTELNVDPEFLNASAGDYRVRGDSPLQHTGKPWGLRCLDLRGRQCWDRPDIGAYYSSSGDPTPTRNAR